MSNTTIPLASCLHDTLKTFVTSIGLPEQSNVCPCYAIVPFLLDQFHNWLSLHGSSSAIASEWTPYSDSALNTFNTTTGAVEAPFALDVDSPSSNGPSPMESDFIPQLLPDTAFDSDNGMDASYLNGLDQLGDFSFNPEPVLELSDSFHSGLNMDPSIDHISSQMWIPHGLPQSPSTSSPNGSLSCDDAWPTQLLPDHLVGPFSYDIQPHVQNFNDEYLSNLGGEFDLHSPTSSLSEERRSDCTSLTDDMDDTSGLCRWDGSCVWHLTVDKSEVARHLQTHHSVKAGGDKDRMTCKWDGCGKEMKKESISRHIVAVHLSNKTECGSCGKQFARFDSKLRHLKNSRRECGESEPHDSRTKRRRLSWP